MSNTASSSSSESSDNTRFNTSYSNINEFQPETVSSLLSNVDFNPAQLHPMAGLGKGVDYLNLDETIGGATLEGGGRRRGWSDELSYGTGTAYILGKCGFHLFLLNAGLFELLA